MRINRGQEFVTANYVLKLRVMVKIVLAFSLFLSCAAARALPTMVVLSTGGAISRKT